MTGFHNVAFPLSLAFGASGGPGRKTDIVRLASGGEQRNNSHAHSRRTYNAAAGIKSLDDVASLIAFFEARQGQLYGFRFRDPIDHTSSVPSQTLSASDQTIGFGDGVQTEFQLIKTYADAAGSYVRPITKPVAGTLLIAINGQAKTGFTVDELTGLITFANPPDNGAIITAGYQFDVPVRFDTDQLDLTLEAFGAGEIASVPLIEVPHASA